MADQFAIYWCPKTAGACLDFRPNIFLKTQCANCYKQKSEHEMPGDDTLPPNKCPPVKKAPAKRYPVWQRQAPVACA